MSQRVPDLHVVPLSGLGQVQAGDDLAALLIGAVGGDAGTGLQAGDVLVLSSKVVSKALGLVHPVARPEDRDAVVAAQTRRVVAERRTPRGLSRVVESAAGPVMAAAGVDASNTAAGTVLSLPADPDAAARALRRDLIAAGAPAVAVVLSDTAGRAWRRGQSDFAIGVAGLTVLEDLRGSLDATGQVLEVTERAIADEVAAAADLVKGKASGIPAALVRGLAVFVTGDDGPGAALNLRERDGDWFRFGHVEAARAALGVAPGVVEPPSVLPEALQHRVTRAARIALELAASGAQDVAVESAPTSGGVRLTVSGPAFWVGVVAQRLLVALWAEDLEGVLTESIPPASSTPAGVLAAIEVSSPSRP